jgi:extradiol dioxygenase family protein
MESSKALLVPGVLRVSHSLGTIQRGRDAVIEQLPREWSAFETDERGESALQFDIARARGQIRGNTALVRYYVDASGGTRWDFDDTGAFLQIYERDGRSGRWLLAVEADVWNLNWDTEEARPAEAVFHYDFAIPVRDLVRAVRFYTPLLGSPEARTANTAVFNVRGSRYVLDASSGSGRVSPRDGLPNGWPIIIPPDFDEAMEETEDEGVVFSGQEGELAGLSIRYGLEPGGNLVALGRSGRHLSRGERGSKLAVKINDELRCDPMPIAVAKVCDKMRAAVADGSREGNSFILTEYTGKKKWVS